MNLTYYPEGMFPESLNAGNMSREQLKKHCQDGMILEAVAQSATTGHDLIVDLGDVRGIIPREETAIGISDGTVRDIAILSRVGKPVCFRVTSTEGLWEPHAYVYLSRRAAAFCDIGCGNVSLLSIEHISISRINHSRDRFSEGEHIFVAILSRDLRMGRINLTHRELLGTWSQNAARFSVGETVVGMVRSVKDYGVFIELTPNLSGLAEYRGDLLPGDRVSVYIKAIVPERQKVKLIVIRTLPRDRSVPPLEYFQTEGSVSRWRYESDPLPAGV